MNAVEILRAAEWRVLSNEDGLEDQVKLLPPLAVEELRELEAGLPCPLPPDARELLSFSRGFGGSWLEEVDFSGRFFAPHGVSATPGELSNSRLFAYQSRTKWERFKTFMTGR